MRSVDVYGVRTNTYKSTIGTCNTMYPNVFVCACDELSPVKIQMNARRAWKICILFAEVRFETLLPAFYSRLLTANSIR